MSAIRPTHKERGIGVGSCSSPDVATVLGTLGWFGLADDVRAVATVDGRITLALHPDSRLARVLCGPWTAEAGELFEALGSYGFSVGTTVTVLLTRPNGRGE